MAYVIWVLVLVQYLIPYKKIIYDIIPIEIEGIDVTIKLANRDTISPVGLLEMLKSCVGKLNILLIFLFLVPHKMTFVPLYLVDPSGTLLMLR